MKNLILLLALSFAVPTVAHADENFCRVGKSRGVIYKQAMNGGAALRTFSLPPKARGCAEPTSNYRFLVMDLTYTKATNGIITMTCTTGQDVKKANHTPQTCVGSGTCTLTDGGVFSKTVTASANFSFRLGIRGYRAWTCVVAHSAPAAGDIITVEAALTK